MEKQSDKKQQSTFSEKYGFHVSHIQFDCGGVNMGSCPHGTLSTEGIDKSNPRKYTSEKAYATMATEATKPPRHGKTGLTRNPLGPCYVWPVDCDLDTNNHLVLGRNQAKKAKSEKHDQAK